MIRIDDDTEILESELSYSFTRSSKPGGQNVNKVSTRVTLQFDIANTSTLTEEQIARIRERLKTRICKKGILRVVSQKHRSQSANREAARERFVELMREALRVTPPRKRKRIPREIHERRLKDKKHRGRLKQERSKTYEPDD